MEKHWRCVTCNGAEFSDTSKACPKGHPLTPIPQTASECPGCHTVGGKGYLAGKRDEKTGLLFGSWDKRDANKLCPGCIRRAEELGRIEKELAKRQKGLKPFAVNAYPHVTYEHPNMDVASRIGATIRALVDRFAVPASPKEHVPYDVRALPDPSNPGLTATVFSRAYFSESDAALVQQLFDDINQLSEAQYESGLARGKDLLMNLASGSMTLKEFDAQ